MRNRLNVVSNGGRYLPDHVGLAYDVWAPTATDDGKIPDNDDFKSRWLEEVAGTKISPDYQHAFKRWEASFTPEDQTTKFTLSSRLLIGYGNAAPTEVGLTVHHTWGVPVIPGSALKGLCAHYVETIYGPDSPKEKPWEEDVHEKGSSDFQGVKWNGTRIKLGPGQIYRALFGAPDAEEDKEFEENGYAFGASQGDVIFHDALYIPGSANGQEIDGLSEDQPFAVDVLTVHQKSYYDAADGNNQPEPNDYDDPKPVGFLSVRSGAQFQLALSGPDELVELANYFLKEALNEWGIGGKTSAGYGRLISAEELEKNRPLEVGDRVRIIRCERNKFYENRTGKVNKVLDRDGRAYVQITPHDKNRKIKGGAFARDDVERLPAADEIN